MASYLLVLVVLAVAFYVITGPLLSARKASAAGRDEIRALQAARESKYQEIRDVEMDLRTGKLADHDYEAIDQALRGEAIEILHRLDEAEAEQGRLEAADREADPSNETGRDQRLPFSP